MKQVKRWWVAVLLGILLVTTLAGVVLARPSLRPEAGGRTKVLTVAPQACVGQSETTDYAHWSNSLQCLSTECTFVCAFNFPHQGRVRVRRVTMYVYDNFAGQYALAYPVKVNPATASVSQMSSATSTDSADDPQAVVDNTIVGNPVRAKHGPYIYLHIAGTSIKVYGFKIHYIPL